jgi:hypothetical protein
MYLCWSVDLAGGFLLRGIFIEDGVLPRNSCYGCVDVLVVVIKEGAVDSPLIWGGLFGSLWYVCVRKT